MEEKTLRKSAVVAALWIVIALLALTGAAFAWFTFTSSATVEPMRGRVSDDGINLLISNSPDGPFDTSCELIINKRNSKLTPITTTDLKSWRVPAKQDKEGKVLSYRELSENVDDMLMHGKVYLTNKENSCEFILDAEGSGFGENALALSAMRFGIKVSSSSGTITHIYKTDSSEWQNANLGRIDAGDIATFEYWLWLEGEDPECTNAVQRKDAALEFQFKGIELK